MSEFLKSKASAAAAGGGGAGFSLWLDPESWPVPPLKLPGRGFSVWQDPARWPKVALRLPGRGFTVWTQEAAWPKSRIQVPGAGHTLWLKPESWPKLILKEVPAASHVEAGVPAAPAVGAETSLPTVTENDLETLEPKAATENSTVPETVIAFPAAASASSVSPVRADPSPTTEPGPVSPVILASERKLEPETNKIVTGVFPPSASMPLKVTQNKAFTLWTKPGQVQPVAMKNGLTAAQFAALGAPVGTSPSAANGSTVAVAPSAAAIGPAPAARVAARETAPVRSGLSLDRWLPLGAGLVAIMGLNALISAGESRKAAVGSAEIAGMNQQVAEVSKGLASMKERSSAELTAFNEKTAALETQAVALKQQKDLLVTDLAKALEAARRTEARLAEQDALITHMTSEVEAAKLQASKSVTEADSKVVSATEEASRVKRESGAEVTQLREALARVEAEKAAAIKAAAEAATALNEAKTMLESAPKAP
ncbi:MAG: hypothetical protein JWL81_2403 [Verrucomicrobiales bacterium]|nr:hypothetical protein [Verrucomicrobiales bacterium]